MLPLPAPAALQRFADDELVRVPLLVDQMVDAAIEHMREGMRQMQPHERAIAGDLMLKVQANRQHVVDYYVHSLRNQVQDELRRGAPLALQPGAAPKLSLSLVDEDEVAVDVEISHSIEAIRSIAEYELRELQTYVSALVGDMDVARDHNPFRAEAHARALWAGAQALPLSRGYQLVFMRHASIALAQVLRKSFAAASSRLEAMGVEPASHRTLILPSGSRRNRPSSNETTFTPDLLRIRDSMPVQQQTPAVPKAPLEQLLAQADAQLRSLPADAGSTEYDRLREQQRRQLVESAATPVDQQLVELLSRLFDAILADRALPPDIKLLLSRLQAPALRVALRDPKTLDKEGHPVWQFADQVAFFGEILPPPGHPEREQVLRFVQGLLDHLVAEEEQTGNLYHWASERLRKHEHQRLEQRCHAAQQEIVSLQAMEERIAAAQPAAPLTLPGAIDVAQLDTVPADLIAAEPARQRPPSNAQEWLDQRRPGDWVRLFMQGRWVHAQLLWPGDRNELFLFGDGASATTWAMRRRALLTLHGEGLLDSLEPRSLVRDAAKRVMRQMAR